MKFESKMAQEAYDEIMKLGHNLNSSFDNEFQLSYTARAIEVAAKIEIEQYRAEFEHDASLAKRGAYPAMTAEPCEHDWVLAENFLRKPGRYCTKCKEHQPDWVGLKNPHDLVYKQGGKHTKGSYYLCERCRKSWDTKPSSECSVPNE
jgi:hypothetical protein